MPERIVMRTGEALVEGDADYLCAEPHRSLRTSGTTTTASPTIGSNTTRDSRERSVPVARFRCPFVWAFFGTDW